MADPIIVTDNTLEGQISTLLRYVVAAGGRSRSARAGLTTPPCKP